MAAPANDHGGSVRAKNAIAILIAAIFLGLAMMLIIRGIFGASEPRPAPPPQAAQGCQVTVEGFTTSLTHEQAHNAAIIVGEAMRRQLSPRAASIALTTAYQESDLRNLDYGDRDSVGLFQQRPSQGWGSVEQIMDPWYSAGKFYEVLVTIPDWETGDINDVAQAVQRSGFPHAYRKHEQKGRSWASALTGHSAAAVSCVERSEPQANALPLTSFVELVFGDRVGIEQSENQLIFTAPDPTTAWAVSQSLLARSRAGGVTAISVGGHELGIASDQYPSWQAVSADPSTEGSANKVIVTLRG